MNSERFTRIRKVVGEETSKFLVQMRESAGLTQAEAAKLLGHSTVASLIEYESGNTSVPMQELQRTTVAYGMPTSYIFEYTLRVQQLVRQIE